MNASNNVIISESDLARIQSSLKKLNTEFAESLQDELDSATVLADQDLPDNVVNMGATVTFRDINSGQSSRCTLVFPHQADAAQQRISVLAPVGAALIGLSEGATINWPIPGGKLRALEVISVEQVSREEKVSG